jgi:hypothetical protein
VVGYDPLLGRFTSPDSIIPDPGSVIGYIRFAYVNNDLVMYSDPAGKISFWVFMVTVVVSTVVLTSDQPTPENPKTFRGYPPTNCGVEDFECYSTLQNCFGDTVLLKDFSDNNIDNPISIEEFEDFLDEVAEDLYSLYLSWPGCTTGRDRYDTLFYNNGGRGTNNPESDFDSDQEVCIESIGCYGGSEINYVAQGMWEVATNEPENIIKKSLKLGKLFLIGVKRHQKVHIFSFIMDMITITIMWKKIISMLGRKPMNLLILNSNKVQILYLKIIIILSVGLICGSCQYNKSITKAHPVEGLFFELPYGWKVAYTERDGMITLTKKTGLVKKRSSRIEISGYICNEYSIHTAQEKIMRDIDRFKNLYNVDEFVFFENLTEYDNNEYHVVTAAILFPVENFSENTNRNQQGSFNSGIFQPISFMYVIENDFNDVKIRYFPGLDEKINNEAEVIINSITIDCP